MKKVTSALALAALIGSPAAFAQVEFGGDFDARAFGTRSGATDELATGADQRIRLQATFESEGGVQVHTRLNLMNDRWTGDSGGGVQGGNQRPYSDQDHRNVELDYGYVTLPLAGGRVNVGRQIASWGHGLTLTDDRRDRISYVRPLGGGHTGIALADRRYTVGTGGGVYGGDPTRREDDGNMYALAALGPLSQNVTYGFLAVQWEAGSSGASASGYSLRGASLISPYIEGESGNFDYKVGGHYLGGGRGSIYTEDTMAAYVKTGFQLTPEFKLEGQVLHTMDGNLVDSGYDTYSSLIHNSPNNDQSATSIGSLGLTGYGGGTEADDGTSRTLVAARGSYEVMDWTFMLAGGWVNYNDDDLSGVDEDVLFADVQAHYQLTPSTKIYATGGYATSEDLLSERQDVDDALTAAGADAVYGDAGGRKDSYATSLNIETQF